MQKNLTILLLVCLASLPAAGGPDGRSVDTVAVDMDVIGGPDTLKARISGLMRLGFEQLERDDPESARESFEAALPLDPGNARVQVGLGRSYLEHKPGRVGIFELIERLFNQDFLSRAISCLNKALELDPDSWEAHYWLGSAYMKKLGRDDLERALEHMEQAYRLGGDRLQVRFKMALLHKALGDIQNAEQILFEINSEAAGRVDPLACLELVKINAKRMDFREAHRYYWRGVGSISTREEFQAYFDDLVVIATEDEHQAFLSTPPDSAETFFRGFWLRRDHRLEMEPGMRLAYHYYRLSVADSLFRVPFSVRNPAINPSVAYFPEEGVPYDDRGIIYILHGAPDKTVSYLDGEVDPNETWVYYRVPEDLILHFVALRGNHEYQLVHNLDAAVKGGGNFLTDTDGNIFPRNSQEGIRADKIRELYGSRFEIGRGLYFRLSNYPGDSFARMEEYEKNYLSIYEALNSESAGSGYQRKLTSFYDLVDFRGSGDGRSVLEFYAGVPGSQITYSRSSRHFNYDIAYRLEVYDSLWHQVGEFNRVESFESLIDPHDLVDRLVVGLGEVRLEPGNYYYFIRIQNGEAVGQYNGAINVESFEGDSLKASEIIAADNIFTAVADSGKFKRYDLQVHPNPSRVFRPTDKMFAYQEIYNLKPAGDGTVNYRVTYTLTRIKRERNLFGGIVDSFKWMFGSGKSSKRVVVSVEKNKAPQADNLVPEDVEIDISANPEGLYELTIQVEDLNAGGRMFQRNTRFSVKR